MTYSDLVTFLLDTASGLTYLTGATVTGLTIQSAEFGPDFNLGMNANTIYPLFYLIPMKSTTNKDNAASYTFQVIVLDKILTANNRTDRSEKYSNVYHWLQAYFQYLQQILSVQDISYDPIETGYDQLATGWVGNITITDYYPCILITSETFPENSNLPDYGVICGTSGTSGTSGIDGNLSNASTWTYFGTGFTSFTQIGQIWTDNLNIGGYNITNVNNITVSSITYADTYWDDLKVDQGMFEFLGNADPTLVNYNVGGSGLVTKLFEFALNDEAYFTIQVPHSYKVNSNLQLHLHWTPGSKGITEDTHTVGWKVDLLFASIGNIFPSTLISCDLSDECQSTNHQHLVTPSATVTVGTMGISAFIIGRIYRNGQALGVDTWSGTKTGELPLFLGLDFHYEMDSPGSRNEYIK